MTQSDNTSISIPSTVNASSPAVPDTSATPQTQTKAFSLLPEDMEAIETVRQEERLMSDSAALRLLIAEGRKYRELRQGAERELMARLVENKTKTGR